MTQKFLKLLLLVSCVIPVMVSAKKDECSKSSSARAQGDKKRSADLADMDGMDDKEDGSTRKPFTSLQVAGPLAVTGLASLNALNVKKGADFGADVGVDGNLYVDGGIVLDSCLMLTCTTAGQLLVNNIAVSSATGGAQLGQYGYVYSTATQTITASPAAGLAGTGAAVQFDNIGPVFPAPDLIDNEDGSYTVVVGGVYRIDYQVVGSPAADGTFDFELYLGALTAGQDAIPGTHIGQDSVLNAGSALVSGSAIVNLAPNSTISLQALQASGLVSDGSGDTGRVSASIAMEKIA